MKLLQPPYKFMCSECPVASQVNILLELAIKLNTLTCEVEACLSNCPLTIEQELEKAAIRFDKACARAAKLGVPLNTELTTTDHNGRYYLLSLTNEGVEYRVA